MTGTDILVIVIVAVIIAAITVYLVRARRRGEKCVGCPYAKQCAKRSCTEQSKENK